MFFDRASDECLSSCCMAESSSVVVGYRHVTCFLVSIFLFRTSWQFAQRMKVSANFMKSIGKREKRSGDLIKLVVENVLL